MRYPADLPSLSSGQRSAANAQVTLVSDARTYFVPADSAGVSLRPRLRTRLTGFRSAARVVTPQRTSATAFFN